MYIFGFDIKRRSKEDIEECLRLINTINHIDEDIIYLKNLFRNLKLEKINMDSSLKITEELLLHTESLYSLIEIYVNNKYSLPMTTVSLLEMRETMRKSFVDLTKIISEYVESAVEVGKLFQEMTDNNVLPTELFSDLFCFDDNLDEDKNERYQYSQEMSKRYLDLYNKQSEIITILKSKIRRCGTEINRIEIVMRYDNNRIRVGSDLIKDFNKYNKLSPIKTKRLEYKLMTPKKLKVSYKPLYGNNNNKKEGKENG